MRSAGLRNRIRSSVESLLTHLGIPRFALSKAKKRVRITAHHRVEAYRQKDPALGDALLAVKWLGNAGSHTGSITEKDLFDGFDLMQHALHEIFLKPGTMATKLAKRIIRKRGR